MSATFFDLLRAPLAGTSFIVPATRGCAVSVRTVLACDRPPCQHLLAQKLAQFLGSAEREQDLLGLRELFGDARFAQTACQLGAEPAHDHLRRARRRKHAPPSMGLKAWKAAFPKGRHRVERRRAGKSIRSVVVY
jgi:hypothetical protein